MKKDLKSLLSAENIQVLVADDMAVIKGGGKGWNGCSTSKRHRHHGHHSEHGHHSGQGHNSGQGQGQGHYGGWGGCRPYRPRC